MKAAPSCRSFQSHPAPSGGIDKPFQAKAIKILLRADSQDSIRFILLSRQNIPQRPSPLKTQKNQLKLLMETIFRFRTSLHSHSTQCAKYE